MINFIVKFLLTFLKYKVEYRNGKFGRTIVVRWKELFGRVYLHSESELPPVHPNCRCSVVDLKVVRQMVRNKEKCDGN